jgi:hypothetical protein
MLRCNSADRAVAASANIALQLGSQLGRGPKALNMTMRRTHPMNIYGLVMIDNLIAPAARDDVASRPRQEVQKTTFSDDRQQQKQKAVAAILPVIFNWPALLEKR